MRKTEAAIPKMPHVPISVEPTMSKILKVSRIDATEETTFGPSKTRSLLLNDNFGYGSLEPAPKAQGQVELNGKSAIVFSAFSMSSDQAFISSDVMALLEYNMAKFWSFGITAT